MILRTPPSFRLLAIGLMSCLPLVPVSAQVDDPARADAPAVLIPKGVEIQCEDTLKQTPDGYACTGPVAITWRACAARRDWSCFTFPSRPTFSITKGFPE